MHNDLPDAVWWPLDIDESESLLGFAGRTMEDNVLPHMAAILREAGQAYRNRTVDVVSGDVRPEALAAVLGVEVEEVKRRRGSFGEDGCFRFMGVEMRPEDVCTRVRRFAPGGLRLNPIHRAAWMLRQLPFCAESWQPLICRCSCDAVQDWTMVRDILFCQGCGGALADVPVEAVPAEQQQALQIYANLLSHDGEMRDAALAQLPADLAATGAGSAVDMILALVPIVDTSLHRSVRHPGTWRDRPLQFTAAIARVMAGLLGRPRDLATTLFGCRPAEARPRSAQLVRLSSLLMGRGRVLLPPACLKLLEDAAAEAASPGSGDERVVDFAEAETLLGRRRRTLRAARRSGLLRTAFFIRRGELLPALDRTEVERLAAEPGTGPNTFGRTLHLPAYAVEQMADTGVLRWIQHPFVLETQGVRICEGEKVRLLDRLASLCTNLFGGETMTLSTLLRSIGGRAKPYGHLFEALLDDRVPFALVDGSMLVSRIVLRREDAKALRSAALARPEYIMFPAPRTFMQMDACDILNLHLRNRAAVLTLEHDARRGGTVLAATTVLEAAGRFVTAGELAASLGRSAMTIAANLRGAGFRQTSILGWERSSVSHPSCLPSSGAWKIASEFASASTIAS
ncbi:hypothetical protein ACYZX9_11380 [Sphingomonas citri]